LCYSQQRLPIVGTHRGPTDSGIFAVREMVFQEELEKMLLVQKAALSVKTPLCLP
jgi:hypothetical protein